MDARRRCGAATRGGDAGGPSAREFTAEITRVRGRCTSASAAIPPRAAVVRGAAAARPQGDHAAARQAAGRRHATGARSTSCRRINSLVDRFDQARGLVPTSAARLARQALDHIPGDVELRIGRDGEEYAGIRKDTVHVGRSADHCPMTRRPVRQPDLRLRPRTMVTPATSAGAGRHLLPAAWPPAGRAAALRSNSRADESPRDSFLVVTTVVRAGCDSALAAGRGASPWLPKNRSSSSTWRPDAAAAIGSPRSTKQSGDRPSRGRAGRSSDAAWPRSTDRRGARDS